MGDFMLYTLICFSVLNVFCVCVCLVNNQYLTICKMRSDTWESFCFCTLSFRLHNESAILSYFDSILHPECTNEQLWSCGQHFSAAIHLLWSQIQIRQSADLPQTLGMRSTISVQLLSAHVFRKTNLRPTFTDGLSWID